MIFIFESYSFDEAASEAIFNYAYSDGRHFQERVSFARPAERAFSDGALDRALFLAFIVAGVSYAKAFPVQAVELKMGTLDAWQARFMNYVYQEGLSQYAFENKLTRSQLPQFSATSNTSALAVAYSGSGSLVLQSGGKDSLLLASMLEARSLDYQPWYISSSDTHPSVLDTLAYPLAVSRRTIDSGALRQAAIDGGYNGHVPVTFIVQSYALIQAILLGKKDVLTAIGHEGEEPHARIDDLAITHQWSKTAFAEELFSDYVYRYVSPDISIGSPLRHLSELRIAELFATHSWGRFGHEFSSCNRANYEQGANNARLTWCGECPKCANSYLLFAPFIPADELTELFSGEDLFTKPMLQDTFKGLLGVDDVMKPFECIGEVDELRLAYHKAQASGEYGALSFDVPVSGFDYLHHYGVGYRSQDLELV